MYDEPQLRQPAWLGILFVALVSFATALSKARQNPTDIEAALITFIVLLALIVALAAILSGFNWAVYTWIRREEEWRRVQAITPRLEYVRAVSQLTPEQARLVPLEDYRAKIIMTPDARGDKPHYFLQTNRVDVPIEFIYDFLMDSNMTKLRAVRTYPDKTPAREQARAFTDWLIMMGLATPDAGSNPAMWVTEHSKARAFSLVGLEWQPNGLDE